MTFIGHIVRAPLALIPREAVVPVLSGPNRGFRWIVGSHTHGCWIGWYEKSINFRLPELVSPGATAFDVGANVGYYTLMLSRLVGPTGKVFAFEPNERNLLYLRKHLTLNQITNVEIVAAAVSNVTGIAKFTGDKSTGRLSNSGRDVPTVCLDGFPRPEVVKMDIEGGEGDALLGSQRILSERRTNWFVAVHGYRASEQTTKLLEGYKVEWIESDDGLDQLIARPQ
jgi:FkbM family methyltransferase